MYHISSRLHAIKHENDLVLLKNNQNNLKCWFRKNTWYQLREYLGKEFPDFLLDKLDSNEIKKLMKINGVFRELDKPLQILNPITMFGDTVNISNNSVDGSIILVGYDSGNNISLGSRKGPDVIRRISDAYETSLNSNLTGIEGWLVNDLWNSKYKLLNGTNLNSFYIDDKFTDNNFLELLASNIAQNKKVSDKFWMIGGDHSITYGGIKSLINKGNNNITLVYFDAHVDAGNNKVFIDNSNFIARISEFDEVKNIFQVGRRGVLSLSNTSFSTKKIQYINSVKEIASSVFKNTIVYCSIDLDYLDFSIAPGVSTPVPKGNTLEKLEEELYELNKITNINCGDVTEYNPDKDVGFITGQIVLRLLLISLGLSLGKYEESREEKCVEFLE
ncbi:arginase family protein [Lysinibacillus parviboronicapiens]|uniref:arginase family protein n=1 Tax=Lysinibacillus parviboronicapiens TaxID=436516 RepID=UPI000D34C5FE|nr:arginase family protein [Lysinibacillus parviboronicapiens]